MRMTKPIASPTSASAATATKVASAKTVGGTWMAREGGVVPGYDEAPVVAHMKGREIEIEVDLGLGEGSATVWTCDLTHGYIDINGSYRS